jgi:hypothetical protein
MARTSTTARKFGGSSSTRTQRPRRANSSAQLYGDAIGLAGSLLRGRQEMGAEKIDSLAAAARDFAGQLPDIPNIQNYAHAAADQMETLANYVAETPLEEMVSDAGAFAKRYPLATAAFAVAAGFGLTRLLAGTYNGTSNAPKARRATAPSKATKTSRKRSASASKSKANGRFTGNSTVNAA